MPDGKIEFALQLEKHHRKLIDGIEPKLREFKALAKKGANAYIEGQIKYFTNAIAALEWSIRVAKQEAKIDV